MDTVDTVDTVDTADTADTENCLCYGAPPINRYRTHVRGSKFLYILLEDIRYHCD